MDIFQERFKKLKKKTNYYLLLATIFMVLGLTCLIYASFVDSPDERITMHALIEERNNNENIATELTVTDVPYVFAEYDSDEKSPKYYFLMDDKFLYIGYLDYETYQKLNSEEITTNNITIEGITKIIPDDVIDLAIEVYNETLEEEFLTKENYQDYLGTICIDTVNIDDTVTIFVIVGSILIIVGLGFIVVFCNRKIKIKKLERDTMLFSEFETELSDSRTEDYSKFGFYLTPRYIIDGTKGIIMIPYSDISWIYMQEQKRQGFTYGRSLILVKKDRKTHNFAFGAINQSKEKYLEIIEKIYSKNPNMLVGFTKENKNAVKNMK